MYRVFAEMERSFVSSTLYTGCQDDQTTGIDHFLKQELNMVLFFVFGTRCI